MVVISKPRSKWYKDSSKIEILKQDQNRHTRWSSEERVALRDAPRQENADPPGLLLLPGIAAWEGDGGAFLLPPDPMSTLIRRMCVDGEVRRSQASPLKKKNESEKETLDPGVVACRSSGNIRFERNGIEYLLINQSDKEYTFYIIFYGFTS